MIDSHIELFIKTEYLLLLNFFFQLCNRKKVENIFAQIWENYKIA